MSRGSGIRFYHGVRFKLAAGLLLAAALGGALLYALAARQLENNMQAAVTEDLTALQGNAQVYVRQMLMLEQLNNDPESFAANARAVAQELYAAGRTPVSLYTLDGQWLLDYGGERDPRLRQGAAFAHALQGRAAYDLHYDESGRCTACFVTPVVVADSAMGLAGYALDYTSLYARSRRLTHMLFGGASAVLGLMGLVTLFYFNHILAPVRRLSRLSARVDAGMRAGHMPEPNRPAPEGAARRDEISELSRNYDAMLRTVGEQFARIQADRVRILQLLDSRQAFYNNVTHELKTPLTTIQGYAQLMEQDGGADPELLRTGLEHIQHESARLHRMVIQLLEMSDIDRDEPPQPMDLSALVESVCDAMSLKASRYHCLIRQRVQRRLIVLGKEERIRQLFINLIDNAIKYGALEEAIWVEARAEEGAAAVRVVNRGPQIEREQLEHIFEPFYRADKQRSREMGSAGLGLAICKKIVGEHGGDLTADSRDGYTQFLVTLPLWQEEGGGAAQ